MLVPRSGRPGNSPGLGGSPQGSPGDRHISPRTPHHINHPYIGTLSATVEVIPDDPDVQVRITIDRMRQIVHEDATSPEISLDLAQALTSHPGQSPIPTLYHWTQSRLRFLHDQDISAPLQPSLDRIMGFPSPSLPTIEVLTRPRDISRLSARSGGSPVPGDCDDYVLYLATLLHALHIPLAFATIAADPDYPSYFSHIYLVAYPNGLNRPPRIPLDASHGTQPGWEVGRNGHRFKEWPLSSPEHWQ